jgi:bifunctional DNase/RNase
MADEICAHWSCSQRANCYIHEIWQRRIRKEHQFCAQHARIFVEGLLGDQSRTLPGGLLATGYSQFDLDLIVVDNSSKPYGVIYLKMLSSNFRFKALIDYPAVLILDNQIEFPNYPRPLTYACLSRLVNCLGGRVKEVVVESTDARASEFVAIIHVIQDERPVRIDTRLGDALGIAVASDAPVLLSNKLITSIFFDSPWP